MKPIAASYSIFSGLDKYRIRTVLIIAVFWTFIDIVAVQLFKDTNIKSPFKSTLLREVAVFIMSCVMGYLFVFALKNISRKQSAFANFIFKSIILLASAFIINFLVHLIDSALIMDKAWNAALQVSMNELLNIKLLLQRIIYWMVLFIITQLYIEINEKYSPGVFLDIATGKYMHPKIENRIIMFIDLKDSTPIAEKLGHVENFKFIRDFIYHISLAMIEHGGRIYQYVGDEVVVSWLYSRKNTKKSMAAIIEARKNLQKYSDEFRRKYDIIPEFRVGLHVGEVTVGEIGVIKKDLAMSGDTMNTAARIRSASTELNQKFIMSKDFMDSSDLKEWQGESLGIVDLKGKSDGIELFSIKI